MRLRAENVFELCQRYDYDVVNRLMSKAFELNRPYGFSWVLANLDAPEFALCNMLEIQEIRVVAEAVFGRFLERYADSLYADYISRYRTGPIDLEEARKTCEDLFPVLHDMNQVRVANTQYESASLLYTLIETIHADTCEYFIVTKQVSRDAALEYADSERRAFIQDVRDVLGLS